MWLLGILAAVSLPFWLPPEWTIARAWVSVVSVVWAVKLLELWRGRANDPAMLESPGLTLLWFVIPPDTRPARSESDAAKTRHLGRARLIRGAIKAPLFLGLVAATTIDPSIHQWPAVGTLVGLFMVYFVISGLADLASGLVMQSGVWVAESFDAPFLARSPRDFWGSRWNLFIHQIAFRHLFLPLGGLRHPVLAAAGVFAASGLMHEYLVMAAVGWRPTYLGWMLAFFSVHGAAVVAELGLRRRGVRQIPRPVAVAAHVAWMVATGRLFLAPMNEAFSYTSWTLW